MKVDSVIERTARLCLDISLERIPEHTKTRARYAVLDAVDNCLEGARNAGVSEPVFQMAAGKRGGSCTLIGRNAASLKEDAVFYNIVAGSATARNDHHAEADVHPGSVVIPVLLAEAEEGGSSGADLLASVTVGYEVMIRLGLILRKGSSYPLSDCIRSSMLPAPVGVALALARLNRLDGKQAANAAALACHHFCGVEQWRLEGTAEDNYQNAWDALNGMHCVRMAASGVRAASGNLDGRYGLLRLFGAEAHGDELIAGLGERYYLDEVKSKLSGACARVLLPMQLAEEYCQDNRFALEHLQRLVIHMNKKCTELPWYTNKRICCQSEAINSVPYGAAAVLICGSADAVSWLPPYDRKILELAERIELVYDDCSKNLNPDGYRFEAHMEDGGVIIKEKPCYTALSSKGIERRFMRTASTLLGRERAERILDMVLNLEKLDHVRDLMKLLRTDG